MLSSTCLPPCMRTEAKPRRERKHIAQHTGVGAKTWMVRGAPQASRGKLHLKCSVLRQLQTQLARGADQTALDRSFGSVQYLANGSHFHSLNVLQVKYPLLVRCQPSQSTQNPCVELAAQKLFFRVAGGSVVRDLVQ